MTTYTIHDIFRLSNGSTVFAIDGSDVHEVFTDKAVKLSDSRELRQSIRLIGQMHVKKLDPSNKLIALETTDEVHLSKDEAQSGRWALTLEPH